MNENYNGQNQNENPQGMPVCPHCGAPVRGEATFCGNCGNALRIGFAPMQQNVDTMGIFDYILMMILFTLPIVGVILMLYWSFSSSTGINKKNFARAYLVLYIIQIVVIFAFTLLFGSLFTSLLSLGY
ncbi:MAG: zinc ribbon domain-containing protein [Clostridia bacterium]|nr:zinc ribbon domain-containing protein [Clostridia bacterium]